MQDTVLSEVLALQKLSLIELRKKYVEIFPQDRKIRANRPCLIRRIAYHLQEKAYGGLSKQAQERLKSLAVQGNRPIAGGEPEADEAFDQIEARVRRLNRRGAFMPGTVISKVYKGKVLQVTVVEEGFQYEGVCYRSLTAVARAVTGARWNGHAFFGV